MLLEKGEKPEDLVDRKLIQLNLNTENISINYGEDIILPYGVKTGKFYSQNKETILKYLAYYKNLYYNLGVKLNKVELWLVVILSENLVELYDLLENLLNKEKRDKFIRKVIEMSKDEFILSEWEKEKMDYLKEMARIKDAEDKGMAKGIQQGIQENKKEIILNMHNDNMSIEVISKYTNLSVEEVKEIINNLVNEKEGA